MRAERLVALMFVLHNRGAATVGELASALGVSVRTMHRDLAALRGFGVPLWTQPGRHGGVGLVAGWRPSLGALTAREAVALLAMGASGAMQGLGLGSAATAAHAKVAAGLPAGLREQAQQVAGRFHLDAPAWFARVEDSEHLETLSAAVWSSSTLVVGYRRGEQVLQRHLDPLGLVLKAGTWYLVARAHEQGQVRTYRVSRVSEVRATGQGFARPAGFDLAAWWQRSSAGFERSLQQVVVRARLSAQGLRALPHVLEPEVAQQALASAGAPDTHGWAHVEISSEDPQIAAAQLLPLGAEVQVLGPAEVRAALLSTLEVMLDAHR